VNIIEKVRISLAKERNYELLSMFTYLDKVNAQVVEPDYCLDGVSL